MASMSEIRRITWSIYWKWSILALVSGFIAGLVIGFVIGAVVAGVSGPAAVVTGPWPVVIRVLSALSGFAAGFLTLNYLLANAIGKQIGSKRLVLIDAFAAGEK
jgi:hypothetical protein